MENELTEGQILVGKYRVEAVLGRGGMGVVVAARHLVLDERVAIKFLSPDALAMEEAVSRFEREARAAVRIKSEHVVRVTDVGRLETGAPYMVMEFLDGEDLLSWLRTHGPLSVEQAVNFVLQASVALADAHSLGIVHRDLKPQNLFCVKRSDGQLVIKVLDFGISKLSDAARAAEPDAMSVTKTAAIMGSPLYMSPEQVQSAKDVDARSDIWSLGVVLYQLLSGVVPFEGTAFGDVAIKVATQPTPSVRTLRPDVPVALEAVINRCLEKSRDQRYPNVAEFALALLPFATRNSRVLVGRVVGIVQASSGALHDSDKLTSDALAAFGGTLALETGAPWSGTTRPRSTRSAGKWLAVAAVALVAGAVSVGAFFATRTANQRALASASWEGQPTPSVAISAAPRAPTTSVEAARPAAQPEPEPSAPAAAASAVVSATPIRPRAVPATKAVKVTPTSRPECDPPYTLDEQGRKKFKPECYLDRP